MDKIMRNRHVDACLEMFNCLQAEQTITIRKRKYLNKFSVIIQITHCFR